eukprot:TRINITY_DN2467_c0_g1_i1.p1 TRINITY_DN2467_c0_g1~~TRINITY_DN2467_c0_g1_i1.p1  ORF type:complete len:311 (+),score=105.27 TRINITY_DN2467_c0_g1_i1:112-1044(+)
MEERIGFVGLGAMGLPMASLIVKKHKLFVFNRTTSKAENFQSEHGKDLVSVCLSLKELAEKSTIVVTMIDTNQTFEEVVQGLKEGMPKNGIVLNTAFLSKECIDKVEGILKEKEIRLVNSNVFGRPPAAAAGQLISCPAGDKEAVERCRPIISLFSRVVIPVSESPGQGSLYKLIGNFLVSTVVESFAQVLTLSEKAGLDQKLVVEVIATLFPSVGGLNFRAYAERIANEQFYPAGATVNVGLKDTNMMRQLGQQVNCPLPFIDVANQHLVVAKERGWENLDWTVVSLIVKESAGIPLPASFPPNQGEKK